MSDFKSKLPDLKELGDMTGKLFHDLKVSVGGIIEEYKKKRATTEEPITKPTAEKPAATEVTPEPPAEETIKEETPVKPAEKTAKKEPTHQDAKTDE